jgi:hypothetical protein
VQAEPAQAPPAQAGNDGPPRGLIIAAVALTLAAITAVLVFAGLRRTPPAPVAVAAVPAPQAESPECQALLATLPDRLGDYTRADTAGPPLPARPPGATPASPGANRSSCAAD